MLKKPKKVREVYFDHAATTYLKPEVLKSMEPYFINEYGNPSSLYKKGRIASNAINNSRKKIAELFGGLPENIIFTGSGTESDNLAIFGTCFKYPDKKHIITTKIEHHAVLYVIEELEKQGWEVTYLDVDKNGLVDVKELVKNIKKETVLISVMHANNEMGVIEPIEEIGRKILKYRKENNTEFPYFHTDACQSAGYLKLDVEKMHVDLMTINGAKIYGPKGTGMLYVRRGVKIKPQILGGAQEKKLRAGTENVAGIVGMTKAFELVQENKEKESDRLRNLSKYLWEEVQKQIPQVKLNGPEIGSDKRLPNNVNITFESVEGEAMLLYLDEYGIMCSTGSACTSANLEPSHVLRAMGLSYEYAHGSLRFSLGLKNTKADVDYMMEWLPDIIAQLREMSSANFSVGKHVKYK